MNSENKTTISFGEPITTPCLVPVIHNPPPTRCINKPFNVNGEWYNVTAMSFGSPHGAVFVDDVDSVNVSAIGSMLGTHVLFPKGASIVFIQTLNSETLKIRLWQHSEGEIPFTSEAVCVAGTAAMMLQKTLASKVNILIGNETFQVHWDRCAGSVSLTGACHLI